MNLSHASLAGNVLLATFVCLVGPAPAQAPAQKFPVQSQTVNGMTLRLNDARWQPSSVPMPAKNWDQERYQPYFSAFFDLLKDGAVLPPGKTIQDAQRITAEIIGPQGERVRGGKGSLPNAPGDYRTWGDIDPRWKLLRLEFDVRDPEAPPEAGGSFTETVIWKDVPLPPEADKPIEINLSQTTAHGVRVWLEKAKIESKSKRLVFTLRWLPPEKVPDLFARWNIDPDPAWRDPESRVVDDKGNSLKPYLNHDANRIDHGEGGRTAVQCQLPSPDAKTFTVNIKLNSFAPSLRQEKWFRRFHFDLPRQSTPLPPATEPVPPVAAVEIEGAKITLERFAAESDRSFFGRLWLEDRLPDPEPAGATRTWVLRQMFWRDAAGAPIEGLLNPRLDSQRPLYWKVNGSPPAANETGHSFAKPLGAPPAYDKIGLELQLEQRVSTPFKADLVGLPEPEPGAVVEPNQQVEIANLGRFTVRSVGSFNETHTLSKHLEVNLSGGILKPPYGLIVVLEAV